MSNFQSVRYEVTTEYNSLDTVTAIFTAFNTLSESVPEEIVSRLLEYARSMEDNPLLIGVRLDGDRYSLNTSKMIDTSLFLGVLQEIPIPTEFYPDGESPYKLKIPSDNVTALKLGRQHGYGMLEVHYLEPNADGESSNVDLWDVDSFFQGPRLVVE